MSENMEITGGWRIAPLRFRVMHLLYATALIASAGAAFGPAGLIVGILVLASWLVFFLIEPIKYGLRFSFFIGLALLLFICFVPTFYPARSEGRRVLCPNNLKQIGLGLHVYQESYGRFPPTYLADRNGKPMHSWRTLILPFTENLPLYEKYDFDESWDGPNNRRLHKHTPRYQQCPQDVPSFADETSYVAVCGSGTTWTNENVMKFSELSFMTSNRIVVIETQHAGIHWMEPRDYSLEMAIQELSDPDLDGHGGHRAKGLFARRGIRGHNVLLANGAVRFIPILPEAVARDLLTGNYTDIDDLVHQVEPSQDTFGHGIGLVIFVVLALFPSYWFYLRIKNEWAGGTS